jgi:fructokinase
MASADIAKLSHEELPRVVQILGFEYENDVSGARSLVESCDLKLVCVTRGDRGSLLVDRHQVNEHPGYRVRSADTIGAGDAFTAALAFEFLQGSSLAKMNEAGNRMGAWVASRVGGMPVPGEEGIMRELSAIGS